MNSVFKDAAKYSVIFGLGNVSQRIVGFILVPLYTGYFSTQDYGIIGLLEISSYFLSSFLGFGLYMAFNRWYWDKEFKNKQKSLFFTVFVVLFFIGILFFLISLPSHKYFSKLLFDSYEFVYVLRLMILIVIFQLIEQLISALLRLQQRAMLFSVTNVIKLSISLSLTVLLIVKFNGNIESIYEAQLAGYIVYFLVLSHVIFTNSEFSFNKYILVKMFSYGYPLMLAAISGMLFSIADRFLIKFLLGLSELGIYALGFKVANSIRIFVINSIQMAVSPIMYKIMDEENSKIVYAKLLTYFSIVVLFASFVLAILSVDIIKLISKNSDFWYASSVIPILSFSMFFGMLKDITGFGLHIVKKTKIIAWVVLSIAIVNIIFNWILISIFGYVGAAYSLMMSQVLFFILIYYFSNKHYPIPYELLKLTKLFSFSVVTYILIYIVNEYVYNLSLIEKILLLFLFPLELYWFRIVNIAELKSIIKLFKFNKNKSIED